MTDAAAGATGAADTTNAGAETQATQGAADATKAAQTGAQDASGTNDTAATVTGTDKAADAIEPKWRDDWRNALAGKDDKLLARLNRFSSVENVFKSFLELEKKMSSGAYKPSIGAESTPEEIAAFRKAHGIPEKVEKAEDYGVSWPQGYEPTESDTASLNSFLAHAHANHLPPEHVKAAFSWWQAENAKVQQQLYDAAVTQTIANKAEIKAEYGKDYDMNVRLGNADLVSTLGPDQAKELPALTLADGTKLGDHPLFVRYIATKGRAGADDGVLALGEIERGGKSLDDQYNEALDLRFSDPARYHGAEHQEKLKKLSAAKAARSERQRTAA